MDHTIILDVDKNHVKTNHSGKYRYLFSHIKTVSEKTYGSIY